MSSTVPPAAIEEPIDLDTWDIPDLDDVDASGSLRRVPARPQQPAPPDLPASGASTAKGAAPPGAAPVRARPRASESTAGAAAPPSSGMAQPPSSRVAQPPPLPGRRRSTPEAAAASSVARAPSETRPRAATPGSVKEWMRLGPSAEARSSSPERGVAKAKVAATGDTSGAPSASTDGATNDQAKAPGVPAQPSRRSAAGAAASDAHVPVARASTPMRATERPQGTAVPPPANGATPPPLPAGHASPPPLPARQATPPPLPAGYGAASARPQVTPAPQTEAAASERRALEDSADMRPDSTRVVAVPAPATAASSTGDRTVRRVATPAPDTAAPASRSTAAPASAPKPAPSAPEVAATPPSAQVAPAPAPTTAPVTEVFGRAGPAAAEPARGPVEAAATPPADQGAHVPPPVGSPPAAAAKAREAEPAPPPPAVVEAPTAPPIATVAVARALPAAVEVVPAVPVADAGWLAPITEPGPPREDVQPNEASALLDFDAELLPSAGEQPHDAPTHGGGPSICTFWLGPDCYGLDVQLVSEVLLVDDILPVPWAPPALLGLINSRGRIVPVVSLATLLGVSSAAPDPLVASRASPAILIKADSLLAAALVDRAGLVIQIDRAGLIPAERGSAEPWIKGHLRPDERSRSAMTLLDPERLVQRFLDVSRFPDIRSCLASGGHGPARAASAKHRGVEIP